MTDIYDQMFYVLCRWDGFVNRGMFQGARPFDAVVMMSALNCLNLLSVMFITGTAMNYQFLGLGGIVQLCGVLVMAIVFCFNYLYFVKSKRYERVLARYGNVSISRMKGSVAATIVYVLFSFLAFLIPLFIVM